VTDTTVKKTALYSVFDNKGEIQPIPAELDHFAFFQIPRKMALNESELEAQYYELSRRLHPDFFMNAPAVKRILSLEASARLNEAYKTLKDPIERAVYLVEQESGKLEENDSRPPAELLEEILDAQEAVDNFNCCEEESAAQNLLDNLQAAKECFEAQRIGQLTALKSLSNRWDKAVEADEEPPPEVVRKMRSILGLRNYINNILRNVQNALESAS
jgi:molecular chaperone HscB